MAMRRKEVKGSVTERQGEKVLVGGGGQGKLLQRRGEAPIAPGGAS